LFPVTRVLSVTASQPGMAELDETYGGAAGKTLEQFVVVMLGIVQALVEIVYELEARYQSGIVNG
jgi:hypothetical protein